MSSKYTYFNSHNCAPPNCRFIGVYNEKGKVGLIKVPSQMLVPYAKRLYSFMAISDSHVQSVYGNDNGDGATDLNRAITFANNTDDIKFVCHCGDTADSGHIGENTHLSRYRDIANSCTKPIYAITGNHEEIRDTNVNLSYDSLTQYLGNPLYYSFEYGNDVFIMLGESGYTTGDFFADGELQFMYDTLEANRNKRCFVYMHVFNWDDGDSGNPNNLYTFDLFNTGENVAYRQKEKKCFIDLLKHYKNTVWFHGHSHALFELQSIESWSNYSENLGYRSVHIPSITKPKDANGEYVIEGSQGYVVDVYDGFFILKGRDFVKGKYLPIATYKIDTTLQTVEAKTFTDSTGIITT